MYKYKKLTRKYINSLLKIGEEIFINAKIQHHLLNVLRLKNDSLIRVFDISQREFLAKITLSKFQVLKLKILELLRQNTQSSKFKTYLAISLINKKKFLLAMDYAVQLGINVVFPIISSRSQLRYIAESTLQERIISSAEQSERLDIAQINRIVTLEELFKNRFDKILFLNEKEHDLISQKVININHDLLILVGPEGGFSEEEEINIKNLPNSISVSLGENSFTTELAVAVALSYIKFLNNN